jgi:hypothetical protein
VLLRSTSLSVAPLVEGYPRLRIGFAPDDNVKNPICEKLQNSQYILINDLYISSKMMLTSPAIECLFHSFGGK